MSGSFSKFFRSGANSGSAIEAILSSLNTALGTAFAANDGQTKNITYYENLAIAKAIDELWSSNQRMANIANPKGMSTTVNRWQNMLNLIPGANDSLEKQKSQIALMFSLWNSPAKTQFVNDILKQIIGVPFVRVETIAPEQNLGSVPGGATIPGGATLPDGDWYSRVNELKIRLWQPRTHGSVSTMSKADFRDKLYSFYTMLDTILPAYVTFRLYYFPADAAGTITMTAGSTSVVGSGTQFTHVFATVPKQFESVDDAGNVQQYVCLSVQDDTHLTLQNAAPTNNTGGYYRTDGMFLDTQNLDTETFSS